MATVKEKVDAFNLICEGYRGLIDKAPPGRKWIYEQPLRYFERLRQAQEAGEPIAWSFLGVYPEIFYAMDITPLCPEMFIRAIRVAPDYEDINYKYIDTAQQFSVAEHECHLQRTMIGAALCEHIPRPVAIVHSSQPCDSSLAGYPTLASYLEVPHYCIDIPYWRDERTYEYVADEILGLASFLEEKTGRKLHYERLREVVEHSNRALDYVIKINELRKIVPCPIPSSVPFYASAMAGAPDFADYCRTGYELARARVEKGEGHLSQEKKRIAWIGLTVNEDPGLYNWLEEEFGAVSVMSMMGYYRTPPIEDISDIRKIAKGLGKKVLEIPMGAECRGPASYFIESAVNMCRDYKADAAIFAGNIGCKNMWAIIKLVKDSIADEVGIPTLTFECDSGDDRVVSSDSIRAIIKEFMETMVM